MPRFLARATDRAATAVLVERTLLPFTEAADTKAAAFVAIGRTWLAANDSVKALAFAQRASDADPASEGAAFLALDMLPATPEAEAIVKRQLAAQPGNPTVRLLYVRTLATSQRLGEAATEIAVLTQSQPDLAPPWLTLGALELEMKRPKEASEALRNYVRLVEGGAAVTFGAAAQPVGAAGDDEDDTPSNASTALTQAYLLLAQAAEQSQDFAGAERWLAKIDNPQRALEVQARRASLLARQGKMKEARELIRRVPEQSPSDARAKLLAETELLRDRKMFVEAEQVMAQANKAFPDDTDLLYEQAMLDEKLDRVDQMEQLLRRVIELKPDHQHAYNALGYSFADRKVRLPEARELIQKALELSPGEPSITDSMGWVEYRLGNKDEAIRLLQQRLPVAARSRDRGAPRRSALECRPPRRSTPDLPRSALARRPERRAARNAGAPARRPVTRGATTPRDLSLWRRAGTVAATLLLAAGCATVPAHAPSGDSLSGRLTLRVEDFGMQPPRTLSAAFELRGDARAGTFGLSTPLGTMLALARWSPNEVVLTTPQGERAFASLAELTREAVGAERPDRGLVRLASRPTLAGSAEHGQRAHRGYADIDRAGGLFPARLERRPFALP